MNLIMQFIAQVSVNPSGLPRAQVTGNTVQSTLQIVFGFAGAIALLVIALAGLRFVLSQGDPQKTSQARNAIIYAVVGLIVAMLAFTIVTFVVGRV